MLDFLATVHFVYGGAGNYLSSSTLLGTSITGLTFPTLNMADDEVATRAPESDAKEPSMISSEDTPAQKGASMGVRNVAPAS